MARIRTIKPSFWAHEELSALPEPTHMLAGALLNYSDDFGYFNANIGLIRAACTPLREPSVSIPESLRSLQAMGYIRIGVAPDGKRYGHVVHFDEHQKVSHPTESKIAKLPIVWELFEKVPENIVKPPEPLRPEGNKERKGIRNKDSASQTPEASSGPIDLAKQLWDTGVRFLTSRGVREQAARSNLGKWRKDYPDATILQALTRAEAESAVDPIAFITKVLKGSGHAKRDNSEHRDRQERLGIAQALGLVDSEQRREDIEDDFGFAAGGDPRLPPLDDAGGPGAPGRGDKPTPGMGQGVQRAAGGDHHGGEVLPRIVEPPAKRSVG